ncbi:hypothetical protein QE152_g17914 [Popillia japonica]|uniref:Endonuclease/exonuclease/phosphatase domain-containing protein n=1 Tax=Popillia japonica TaxID=7064 RepID=A0AAW1L1I0_POPJA
MMGLLLELIVQVKAYQPSDQGISAIDITLCTASLASKATWKVLDDSFTSDHYPILITLQFNRVLKGTRYPKYKWKIENERISVFTAYLAIHFADITNLALTHAKDKIAFLTNAITQAAEASFKINRPFNVKKYVAILMHIIIALDPLKMIMQVIY